MTDNNNNHILSDIKHINDNELNINNTTIDSNIVHTESPFKTAKQVLNDNNENNTLLQQQEHENNNDTQSITTTTKSIIFPPYNPSDFNKLNITTTPVSLTNEPIRIMSFNVNSLRALLRNWSAKNITLSLFFNYYKLHIICIQETKLDYNDLNDDMINIDGYDSYWSCAQHKKGVSGTVTYVRTGLCKNAYQSFNDILYQNNENEGRIVTTEFDQFILYNIYFPNGGMSQDRLNYKLQFYNNFKAHCDNMITKYDKNIIVVGDINTAHNDIDIHNPKIKQTGFLPIERQWLDSMIDQTITCTTNIQSIDITQQPYFIDTYRYYNPNKRDSYTYCML